jgi:hypothetical protein
VSCLSGPRGRSASEPRGGVLHVSENRDVDPARRVLRFAYAVLLRALASIGGAVTAYGATGMFMTGGMMLPNVIVLAGR